MLRRLLLSCGCLIAATTSTPASRGAAPVEVQLEMKNVRLHVAEGIVLDVQHLRGVMTSRQAQAPPVFDDQRSYVLRVQEGRFSMDMASLEALLNRHVFAYKGAPLEDLEVAARGAQLQLTGKLRKGVVVPFSLRASVSATPDGRMRLHAESIKALGIPAKGLLDLFGLELDDVMAVKARRGLDVQENDIVVATGQVLPPPEIVGRLQRVVVRGDRLEQTFGDADRRRPAPLRLPSPSARNYVYFGGGDITFGKLTMHDADLQLIDADPRDPFDFFPARYNAQLVAGYSKSTTQKGLKTFMPDYDDLQQRRPARPLPSR